MRFLYPDFLWALLLIAIPVIIHLVNLRKHRVVYFSNVSLLKKVRKDTRRKSKLKQILILSSRILMIAAIVLAFAKPYFPTGDTVKQTEKQVSAIYIDNSFSMNAEGSEGRAIESARQKAAAIVNGSKTDTRFTILTNNLDQQHNRFYNKNEVLRLIADIEVTHRTLPMSTVQLGMKNLMDDLLLENGKSLYFISDFQKHTSDINQFTTDTSLTYNFIPVPVNPAPNLYIDTCWFESPTHHLGQAEKLHVRIVNNSTDDYHQVPVNFYVNDSLKTLASVSISAKSEEETILEYSNNTAGLQKGRIEITDYPIVYDNILYLNYTVKKSVNVLLLEQAPTATSKNIRAVFTNDPYIKLNVEQTGRLQISSLPSYAAIIINEPERVSSGLSDELEKFVNNGGTLIVIPAINFLTESYNNLLSAMDIPTFSQPDTIEIPIGILNYRHELYTDVFNSDNEKVELPAMKYRYRFNTTANVPGDNILTFADNSKALTLYSHNNGKVFLFAFPFSHSKNNFVNHVLFLPTLYNMALQSSSVQKAYYTIGIDQTFGTTAAPTTHSGTYMLRNEQSGIELIPTIRQQRGHEIQFTIPIDIEAGNYLFYSESENTGMVSFNYQLNESNFSYYTKSELREEINNAGLEKSNIVDVASNNLSDAISKIDSGRQLWKWFLLIAIFFLLIEAAIICFWPES
ncbi:MAG: BatA domain-containing protein [Prolixibacteraceae bacterium]|jgi:hypothetical protein|nr:BatA domain-containing protein [Prolixibacteraceae bacterium]